MQYIPVDSPPVAREWCGDTVALIDELGMLEKFTFVSTGGGAMLDFLANEPPGIDALRTQG